MVRVNMCENGNQATDARGGIMGELPLTGERVIGECESGNLPGNHKPSLFCYLQRLSRQI